MNCRRQKVNYRQELLLNNYSEISDCRLGGAAQRHVICGAKITVRNKRQVVSVFVGDLISFCLVANKSFSSFLGKIFAAVAQEARQISLCDTRRPRPAQGRENYGRLNKTNFMLIDFLPCANLPLCSRSFDDIFPNARQCAVLLSWT